MKYSELNEKKQRGTVDFPIEYYYATKTNLQYIMALHWHREFEIVHVISGKLELTLDNITYEMYEGDFAFIECGSLHKGTPFDCVYECTVFDLNMLRSKTKESVDSYLMPIINSSVSITSLHHSKDNALSIAVSNLFAVLKEKKEFYELEVTTLLFKIFLELYKTDSIKEISKNRKSSHQNKIIIELIDYIEVHFAEQITLEQLSKISGLSEKYLCKFFKAHTDQTPTEYINNIRINNACHEMRHLGRSVTEAAYNTGFNNLSYFSKVFKNFKGVTPKQYKKK